MRNPIFIILTFILFLVAYVGYSLFQESSPQPILIPQKEERAKDLEEAEKYLQNSQAERALPIIHSHKEDMESQSLEGKKWLNLFVKAATLEEDSDQLMQLYKFDKTPFQSNEKASLLAADGFLKTADMDHFFSIRNDWQKQAKNQEEWDLLDVDQLLSEGKLEQAYTLLKEDKWSNKTLDQRKLRIAVIQLNNNPEESLEMISHLYGQEPTSLDSLVFRAKALEAKNDLTQAEKDLIEATNFSNNNVYTKDQLAEFYRRSKNFDKSLQTWQDIDDKTSNPKLIAKVLFWEKVLLPAAKTDYSNISQQSFDPYIQYLANLKLQEFWNQSAFEKINRSYEVLTEYQSSYWLRLLDALQHQETGEALTLLNHNPFKEASWAPLLEIALKRILNYQEHGSLVLSSDKEDAKPLHALLKENNQLPQFYIELDKLAQEELNLKEKFQLDEKIKRLLQSKEIYTVALLSEGWDEAALLLSTPGAKNSTPEWISTLYITALSKNRQAKEVANYIQKLDKTPFLSLLQAEYEIKAGRIDEAIQLLSEVQESQEIKPSAKKLLVLLQMQKKQYKQALETIKSDEDLENSTLGKELQARIALNENDQLRASYFYEQIVNESSEAKSYLVRQAYKEKNWKRAKELTEALLKQFPDNQQLKDNLKKITASDF